MLGQAKMCQEVLMLVIWTQIGCYCIVIINYNVYFEYKI